jgi:hypothetical protein
MSRLRTRWTRQDGFTLLEGIIVVGIGAILIGSLVAAWPSEPTQDPVAARLAAACASTTASSGSFGVTETLVPPSVEQDLGGQLSRVDTRTVEWRRPPSGDPRCERRYVYRGRAPAGGAGVAFGKWEAVQ